MTKTIYLAHNYELSCPIRQEINRRGLLELGLSAAGIYDWMADSYVRDHEESTFTMTLPYIDDIIPNRHMIRHWRNGSYAERYNDFLRWSEPLLVEQVPSVALAMDHYHVMRRQKEWLH